MTRVIEFAQKFNAKGKPYDAVLIGPSDDIQKTQTWRSIDTLKPLDDMRDKSGIKSRHMNHIWNIVEPHYLAWKKGHETPQDGTPLGSWPAITAQQAEVFRAADVRSVEEVANMTETKIGQVRIPDVRGLKKQAAQYLEGRPVADLAEKMAALEEQNRLMAEQLAAVQKPKRGRPAKGK